MKNKLIAMLVAFGIVGSVSAIEINENLSINGFIDGSISKTDNGTAIDADGDGNADGDTANWGLDEVEVDFLFNVGSVSGEVHVDTNNNGGNGELDIEQAHFSYSLDNGISLTLGRYGSLLGLEREDPAGLYTFSRAYATEFNLGDTDNNAQEGLRVSYAADAFTLSLSIENDSGTIREAQTSKDDLDYEVALSYTGIENLSLGLGYIKDNEGTAAAETDVLNINATYQAGKALLGAEYTELDGNSRDRDAYTVLVDYDVSDKLGVAVRYSTYETTTANVDVDKITIAPNYAITESLGAILEYSDISHDAANSDSDLIALELTYTF